MEEDDITPFPEARNFSVVVAIDLGTFSTGYAFAFGENHEPCINRRWENTNLSEKTLTFLLVKKNDSTLKAFGNKARMMYQNMSEKEQKDSLIFERFKMDLFENDGTMRTTSIYSNNNPTVSVELQDLLTLTLKSVKDRVLDELNKSTPKPLLPSQILWVLTVPAIWDNAAKQIMKQSAFTGGLCDSAEGSNVILALEPEAAALYCCKDASLKLTDGNKFMVIDAGEETIDITAHEVSGLKLKALISPQGGNWGSTYINENYETLLRDIFDNSTIDLVKQKPEWIDVMDKFEEMKLSATPAYKNFNFNIEAIVIEGGKAEAERKIEGYNNRNLYTDPISLRGLHLVLPMSVIQKILFDPLLQKLKDHLRDLLLKPELRGMNYVFLVGGFAESKILFQSIQEILSGNDNNSIDNPTLIIPAKPRIAVLLGAVRFGYQPSTP